MNDSKKTISLADVANVVDTLGISVNQNCADLMAWRNIKGDIPLTYQPILEEARQKLSKNLSFWNEEELKMNFVSVTFIASQLEEPQEIKVFYERSLEGKVDDYEFSVVCNCLVATPSLGGRPKAPYFFLQEFKKEKGDKIDAEAQMLVAMLLAQEMNQDGKPIYGGWFRGENWHFTMLQGREYCTAPTLFATRQDDLQQIVYMLQHLKTIIHNR
jgi:hypothetical protein